MLMEELKINNMVIWSDRWRLGALSKNELMNIGFVSVIIGMLFVMFHQFQVHLHEILLGQIVIDFPTRLQQPQPRLNQYS